MSFAVKQLPKNLVEINFELTPEDIKNELDAAAIELSKQRPISGFRPGKTPYEIVKRHFGEMAIYETALPSLVKKNYVKAVTGEKLAAFGEPQINVTRLAPGNSIAFVATVPLVPKIISLADFRRMKVETKKPIVEEKQIDAAIKDLKRFQTKEVPVDREIREHDKAVVDMELRRENVPVEGGQTRGHGIYLDENYYVPGLKEQMLGLKAGDSKSFTLKFPTEHYQKHLAGKDVEFRVTIEEVIELQHPELDDAFAESLGQENLEKLRALLRKNIEIEAEEKEKQRAEIELLDKMVEKSKFEDMPEAIVSTETDNMIHELKESLARRGLDFPVYLSQIKKTADDLKKEFSRQAEKRIKTALILREIADKENVDVADSEIIDEVQTALNEHADADTQNFIRSDEYHDRVGINLRNRKVIDLLWTSIVKIQ